MPVPFERPLVRTIVERLAEPHGKIQILMGPRQTGKTTALLQAMEQIALPVHFATASQVQTSGAWIRAQWEMARLKADDDAPCVLVLDEVQLVEQWSAFVKECWDEDYRAGRDLRVVLSGSSTLLLQQGLREALTGRFELIRSPHWSLSECEEAFGYSLEDYLHFGGFPGGAPLIHDETRWLDYMLDAVIEPSITRDVMAMETVRKPALMRRLFYLGAPYSAQELSFRKLQGQLDDAGNTTTIAHYLDLLSNADLLTGLQKYSPSLVRSRNSSPRLLVADTALMTAAWQGRRDALRDDPDVRGHLVESAVGAYLLTRSKRDRFDLYWWREGAYEVDFVCAKGDRLLAIEVKSGRVRSTAGLLEFARRYPGASLLVVGSPECPLRDFLKGEVELF